MRRRKKQGPLLVLLLSALLLLGGCGRPAEKTDLTGAGIKTFDFTEAACTDLSSLKIGVVYGSGSSDTAGAGPAPLGDEGFIDGETAGPSSGDSTSGSGNDGALAALRRGTREAAAVLGLSDGQVMEKTVSPKESEDAFAALADAGCRLIFSTDTAFETALVQTAENYPAVDFCQLGGEMAALDALSNTHNYNLRLTEAWFGAGTLAAYMSNTLRIGFLAREGDAEEIAQLTAMYLAALTRNGNAVMDVVYTAAGRTEDIRAAVRYLADLGCDVIGSTLEGKAAEAACEDLGIWFIGKDIWRTGEAAEDTGVTGFSGETDGAGAFEEGASATFGEGTAANASHDYLLVSVHANWAACLVKAATCLAKGQDIPADFSAGLADEGVSLGQIAPGAASEEARSLTAASLESVRTRARMVFAIDGFSVGGERLARWIGPDGCDYVYAGYFHDQDPDFGGSSSVFDIIVDGVTVHTVSG